MAGTACRVCHGRCSGADCPAAAAAGPHLRTAPPTSAALCGVPPFDNGSATCASLVPVARMTTMLWLPCCRAPLAARKPATRRRICRYTLHDMAADALALLDHLKIGDSPCITCAAPAMAKRRHAHACKQTNKRGGRPRSYARGAVHVSVTACSGRRGIVERPGRLFSFGRSGHSRAVWTAPSPSRRRWRRASH